MVVTFFDYFISAIFLNLKDNSYSIGIVLKSTSNWLRLLGLKLLLIQIYFFFKLNFKNNLMDGLINIYILSSVIKNVFIRIFELLYKELKKF